MEKINFTGYNSTFSAPGYSQPSWNRQGLVPAVVFSFCFLLGVPGNIAVIILKPNWKHLSDLSQSLMLNLTISDLICLLTLPLWIYNEVFGWTFGFVACKVLAYLVYCTVYSSQLTVTALSIQRYLVVVRGWRCHHVRKGVLLGSLWLTAVTMCIHAVVTEQLTTEDQWIRCKPHYSSEAEWVSVLVIENLYGLVSFSLTTSGCVSFSVVAYSYIRLHRKVSHATFSNSPRTTRLVTSIIISNFLLWSPLHTINMLALGAICFKDKSLLKFCIDMWDIVKGLAFVNNCINPLLYAFTSHKKCILFKNQQELQQIRTTQTPDISTIAEAFINN
uniref:G-protein coupled receptors family 1 profile domain-containing protein n=1 Tax=Fundulus heteroclitus TaxID=8078 RepID=A0A3Q2T321_FUNHE